MKTTLMTMLATLILNHAQASTSYTCTSKTNFDRKLTLTTQGESEVTPDSIILEGVISERAFELKITRDDHAANWGLNRYVGKKSLAGFKGKTQQTVFLSKKWSENSGRLLEVVIGGETVTYEKYNCSED
jgi:hypothetical protein